MAVTKLVSHEIKNVCMITNDIIVQVLHTK